MCTQKNTLERTDTSAVGQTPSQETQERAKTCPPTTLDEDRNTVETPLFFLQGGCASPRCQSTVSVCSRLQLLVWCDIPADPSTVTLGDPKTVILVHKNRL